MSAREPAPVEVDRLAGTTVGDKYRIERLIGKGGMGAVYAAQNTAIGKRVALKFLSRDAAQNREAARRFQREAQAASLIESEHIVQVFDAGTSADGLPFLVMEHLTGEDLRARLERERQLSIPDAVAIASQVLRALTRAHAAGIVHRDLQPDNVFLCARDDGSLLVKLVDFGISKLERATMSERLTRRGTVLGSAYYMSPEQAQASDAVDQRTDLYGLGVILFEMLAGRPPHLAPTLESVLVAICTQDAPDVRGFRADVPDGMAAAIAKALAREPAARFANATEFLETLGQSGTQGSSIRRKPARSRMLVAGIVATLVGFTLTAALTARRGTSGSVRPATSQEKTIASPALATSEPTAATANAALSAPPEVRPLDAPLAAPAVSAVAPAPASTKPSEKKRRPSPAPAAPKSGVASSLQLSNREP